MKKDTFKPELVSKKELLNYLSTHIYKVLEKNYNLDNANLKELDKDSLTTLLIDVYTKEMKRKPCSLFIDFLIKDIAFESK